MPSFETSTTSTAPSSPARSSGSRVGRRPGPAGRVEAVQLDDAWRRGCLGRTVLVVGPDLLALAVSQAEDPEPGMVPALEELEGEVGRVEEAAGPVEHLGPPRHVLAFDLVHLAPAWQERGRGKVFGRGGALQAVLVDHGADELERRDVAAPDENLAQPPVARPLLT